jgi:hypothetical protein
MVIPSENYATRVNLNTRSDCILCDNLQLAAVITSCPRVQSTTVQDLRQQLASGFLADIDLAMQGTVMLQNNWQLISERCDSAGNETVSEWALVMGSSSDTTLA